MSRAWLSMMKDIRELPAAKPNAGASTVAVAGIFSSLAAASES